MSTIFRIIHSFGWVEFADKTEAESYRDAHHAGCEIEEFQKDLSENAP